MRTLRLLLAVALAIGAAAAANATTITVSSFQIPNINFGGTTCTLRIYSDDAWTDSLGVPRIPGNSANSLSSFQTINCTLSGTTVTIPSFNLPSTTNALVNNRARLTARFYDSHNTPREYLFSSWFIPFSPTTTTWQQLALVNSAQPKPQPSLYLDTAGVQALIDASIFAGVPDASTTVKGKAQFATDGESTALEAVQANDSRLSDQRTPTNGSVTEAKLSFTDLTTANATSLKHGLMWKLSGNPSDCAVGDGTFIPCPGSVGTGLTSLNGQTGSTQTFGSTTNIVPSSVGNVHSFTLTGPISAALLDSSVANRQADNIFTQINTFASLPDVGAPIRLRNTDNGQDITLTPPSGLTGYRIILPAISQTTGTSSLVRATGSSGPTTTLSFNTTTITVPEGGTGRPTLTTESLLKGGGTGPVGLIAPNNDNWALVSLDGVWAPRALTVPGIATGSLSGNGTKLATIAGTSSTGKCLEWDALGNIVTAASNDACGAGSGGGGVSNALNTGSSGAGLFRDVAGSDLRFRNINPASTKITATVNVGLNTVDLDVPDGSTSQKGALSTSTAGSTVAVTTNDSRVPTQAENDALIGTSGTASSTNKYFTDLDPRVPLSTSGKVVYAAKYSGTLGAQIVAAESDCGSGPCTVVVTGGGAIGTQVTFGVTGQGHRLRFEGGRITSTLTVAPVLLKGGSSVECSGWDTIIEEPTGTGNWTFFQAYNASVNNFDEDLDITIRGCQFVGANAAFNSTQQIISVGNLVHGEISGNFFNGTKAIGPQVGGGSSNFGTVSVSGATNASPVVITTGTNTFRDGQRVSLTGVGGNTRANTYATITGASSSPITLTLTSPGVGWSTGSQINVSVVAGCTAANGTWIVTRNSATSYTLQGAGACNSAYTSGGVFTGPPWQITRLTSTTFSLNKSTGNGSYTSGGTASKNSNAEGVIISGNLFSRVASQNVAVVNGKDISVRANVFLAGGQTGGPGTTYFDAEPNGITDIIENLDVSGNIFDARGSANTGNAILIQAAGFAPTETGPCTVIGNTIIGGEIVLDRDGGQLANGILVEGMHDCTVANNIVRRSGQTGLWVTGIRHTVSGNKLIDVGGGGTEGFKVQGLQQSFINNNSFVNVNGVSDSRLVEDTTSGSNTYLNNVGFTYAVRPAITAITNANPAVLTAVGHEFATGQTVTIAGAASTLGTAINGARVVTVLSADTFSIPVNTTSTSAYSGTGATAELAGVVRRSSLLASQIRTNSSNAPQGYDVTATITDNGGAVVDCKAFRAKGDDATDNTSAFNDCIAAAAGKIVFIPAGTYQTDVLSAAAADTRFIGAGVGATILKRKVNSTASALIPMSSARVTFKGITIDGNCGTPTFPGSVYTCSNQASTSYDEIEISGADAVLQDFEIKNAAIVGVHITGTRTKILNPKLTGFASATVGPAFGIQFDAGATDMIVDGGEINDFKLNGVIAKGDSGVTLTNTSYSGNALVPGGQVALGCNLPLEGNCYQRVNNNRFYGKPGLTDAAGIEINSSGEIVGNWGDGVNTGTRFIAIQGGTHYAVAGNLGRRYATGLSIDETVGPTIASITNANPAVITITGGQPFTSGQTVTISGASGSLGTAINGARVATVLTTSTFSIPVDTSALSVYAGGASAHGVDYLHIDCSNDFTENTTPLSITTTGAHNYICSPLMGVDKGAAVASAGTITPSGGWFHVTGTTGITAISGTGVLNGDEITIVFDGSLTVTDGGFLKLAGDLNTSANTTLTLRWDSPNWIEKSRSVN